MRRRSLLFLVFAGWFLVWPASPGRSQESRQDEENYPDASRWPGGELEKIEGRIPSDELDAQDLVAPGSRLTLLVGAGLPAGLALSEGVATRVMSDQAGARRARVGTVEKWFAFYSFSYLGVRVCKYSDAFAVVSADGQVRYVRKRNIPASVDASEPTIPATAAIAVARQSAREAFGPVELKESLPELEIWVEPSLAGRLAWTLTIESTSLTEPKARRYWVAAVGQPQVLQIENLIYFGHSGHSGAISATIWETSPFHPTSNHVLSEVQVTRSPGWAVQVTGLDGRYSYADGSGRATITSILAGPRCVVSNEAGAEMVTEGSGAQNKPINLSFAASGDLETAQTSAFYWVNATYQLARSILDALPKQPFAKLLTRVNIDNIGGICEAFWNTSDQSVNFLKAGNRCPNSAYSDVVAHEYGHGVDHWHGEISEKGYSEGFGDAMALLLTRQPCMGRDLNGAGTCFRNADTTLPIKWNLGLDTYKRGRVYAQFVWRVVKELKKTLSEEESFRLAQSLVLAAAAADPESVPDAVELSFIADDNDGNLANGTPHCKELVEAVKPGFNIPLPLPPLLNCP